MRVLARPLVRSVAAAILTTALAASAAPPAQVWSEANLAFDEIGTIARSPKDQFEKTSDYDRRKCEAVAGRFKAAPGDLLTFRLKNTKVKFDADKQQYILESMSRAPGPSIWRWGNQSFGAFYLDVASREIEKPGYVGQNSYGVSRQVQVRESQYIVVLLPRKQQVEFVLRIVLPVKTGEPRALQGDLQVDLVSRLKPPCIYFESHREDPTIRSPVKELSNVYELHLDRNVTTWRVVRASSGEVLKAGRL